MKIKKNLKRYFKIENFRELSQEELSNYSDSERYIELSFSSEIPYEREFGFEVLDHNNTSVNLERLNQSGPVLFNHNLDDLRGVIVKANIINNRGVALIKIAKTEKGLETLELIKDGILVNVSVGYVVNKFVLDSVEEEKKTYRAVDWEPYEISLVTCPADITVGINRSINEDELKEVLVEEKTCISKEKKSCEKCGKEEDNCECEEEVEVPEVGEFEEKSIIDNKNIDNKTETIENIEKENNEEVIKEILAIGEHFKCLELAKEFIDNNNFDVKSFKEKVSTFKYTQKKGKEMDNIELSQKEKQEYNFFRGIEAKLENKNSLEIEVSNEIAKQTGKEARGLFMPHTAFKRDLVIDPAQSTNAKNLVAEDFRANDYVEVLRNRLVLAQAGATFLSGLKGNVVIPKQTGSTSAAWVNENGVSSESSPTFTQLTMKARSLKAETKVSRLALKETSMPLQSLVLRDIMAQHALAIDLAGLVGDGSGNSPTGVLNTSGVNLVSIGANGGALTFAKVVEMETALNSANVDSSRAKYITNSKVVGSLKTTQKGTNLGFVLENGMANGYDVYNTNMVPSNLSKGIGTNLSAMFFGNWEDLLIGLFGSIDVVVDPYTYSSSGAIKLVAFQEADVNVRHAESFTVIKDIIA